MASPRGPSRLPERTRPTLGRRRLLRTVYGVALIGGIATLAIGWYAFAGGGASEPPLRLREGAAGQPSRVQPPFASPGAVDADLAALLYSGLMRLDGDGTPVPDLAERWEVTPDGLTYTFVLRSRLFWHDGVPLTARDVAFTIALLQAERPDGPPALAAAWRGVTVIVPDGRTVIAHLPAPSVAFLAHATVAILPRDRSGPPASRSFVGSGPYRLIELTLSRALLERNPAYHLGTPQIEEIELRFYDDVAALGVALAAGEIDSALLPAAPSAVERETIERHGEYTALPLVESGYTVLYMNNQQAPLNDAALRGAIAAAIDPRSPPGEGLPGEGVFVPGSWAYVASQRVRVDAETLLVAAGWRRGPDGVRVREGQRLRLALLTTAEPSRNALARAVATQLEAVGVAVDLVTLPSRLLIEDRLGPRDYQLAIVGWDPGADPDPYPAWHTSQIAPGSGNIAGFTDSRADAALEAARLTLDITERVALYQRFGERFRELAPAVILQYPTRTYVVPVSLTGPVPGVLFDASSRFLDVHRWRFASR